MSDSMDTSDTSIAAPLPLSPMTFSQLLDRIYRLLRANLRLLVGIASVPTGAFFALYGVMAAILLMVGPQRLATMAPDAVLRFAIPAALIACVPVGAVFALYLAAACHAATRADAGVRATLGESYAAAWKHAGRYLLLLLLMYLVAFLPLLLLELAVFGGTGLFAFGKAQISPGLFALIPVAFLLYLAAYVYGVVMAMRLSLAFPASVVEGLTARAALKRSGQLTQGAKGRIFLVLLVVYACTYVLFLALFAVGALCCGIVWLVVMLTHLLLPLAVSLIGAGVLGVGMVCVLFLMMALSWAALTTALAVLYHEQRRRKDGILPAPQPGGESA